MRLARLGLRLLLSALLYPPILPAQVGRQIAQKAFPSTVLLSMSDTKNQPISLGSGFFVGPNLIVTNLHVIEGAAAGTAKLMGEKSLLRILGSVAVDGVRDLALLSVAGSAPPPAIRPRLVMRFLLLVTLRVLRALSHKGS